MDAFIIDACRTPIGRHGGALAAVRPDDLAATVVRAIVERTGVEPESVEDVIFGCANQAGEDNRNVARMAALLAGLPTAVPGQTVNRLCGSGLQAVIAAAHAIRAGEGECFIAGGVESMSRAPWVMLKPEVGYPRGVPETADSLLGWRFVNPKMPPEWTVSLGETAEIVAEIYGVTREEQDAFAHESQRRTAAAMAADHFRGEIVPVAIAQRKGPPVVVDTDEHPRADTTLESLAALRPAFRKQGGTVTAGNASGLNDGAAALLVTSARVDPDKMGIGPVPASRKALERAGLRVSDLGLVELNEAFAAQSVACIHELELDPAIVNVSGGAVAVGHPLGSSGARILTTLVHEMHRRQVRYGLATMCIGVGQGISMIVERVPEPGT